MECINFIFLFLFSFFFFVWVHFNLVKRIKLDFEWKVCTGVVKHVGNLMLLVSVNLYIFIM